MRIAACLLILVTGCAGVMELAAEQPFPGGDGPGPIVSDQEPAVTDDASVNDTAEPEPSFEVPSIEDDPAPEVRIETKGRGSVVEGVASSEGNLKWAAIPAASWVFDRWEFVGTTFREDGTEVIYRGGFFLDNPLELDAQSEGVLTAVFVEDVPEPDIVDEEPNVQGDPPDESRNACIDADDVLAIPPGTASGTGFSGEYEIVSGFLKGCETCGANTAPRDPCDGAFATVQEGATGTIVQDDGFLSIVDAGGQELVGGINADGTVTLGTIGPVMDSKGEIVGRAFALFEGRFVGDTLLINAIFRISTSEGTETSDYAITNEVVYVRIESR